MSSDTRNSIQDLGVLYDSVPLYAVRKDVGFYVEEAKGVRGQILELGCGTGRVLLPIAQAGATIVGLDDSEQMLARCRAKIAAEPAAVQARITLHQGDMRDFDLGATYPLVIAPFRVMQHLTTIEDQVRALAAIARHLARGGRFVFDVFNPDFAALAAADGVEREDTPEHRLPDGGTLRRTARVKRVRTVDQISEIELIYYVSGKPGASVERFVDAFEMRWYLRAELEHLLARAGFRIVAMYGDFARSPLTNGSPEQVVCAELA